MFIYTLTTYTAYAFHTSLPNLLEVHILNHTQETVHTFTTNKLESIEKVLATLVNIDRGNY